MAYRIEKDESVEEAVRRIAREQVDRATRDIDDDELDCHETVHEVRKRCKKIRGLLRLVRPALSAYSIENAWFRDAARSLAEARDATTLIESYDALMDRSSGELDAAAIGRVRRELEVRRDADSDVRDIEARLDEFRGLMNAGRERIEGWELDSKSFSAIRGGLKKTFKRACRAMRDAYAEPSPERFHEWRKRVKYHRYHMRLLRDTWPTVMGALRDENKRLSDILGDAHDLDVLRASLTAESERFGDLRRLAPILALIDRRRNELRARAHPLGSRIFAETPKRFAHRLGGIWQAWRAECALSGGSR